MGNGCPDGVAEIAGVKEGLSGRKDVRIQHVSGVAAPLDVRCFLRECVHDLYDLVADVRRYSVRVREGTDQMSALSEVDRMHVRGGANDAGAMQHWFENMHEIIKWSLGETCWRHFPKVVGYGKRQLQIVEYRLQEIGCSLEAVLEGVVLCADQANKQAWVHTVYRIPCRDMLNARRRGVHGQRLGRRLFRAEARSLATASLSIASKSVLPPFASNCSAW